MVGLFVNAIFKLGFVSTVVISVERTFVAFFVVVGFVFNIRINFGDAFFLPSRQMIIALELSIQIPVCLFMIPYVKFNCGFT
jgi:hypothetical protein